ncbi:MAG: hypothetical protein GFH27_549279n442 [Chloroflexi bacterium AL-W]|nr:hypothetical protein [Chloroflexi bacterium AL-N1]NOK65408.1 hypothetical protein [Chloroflexi bacterium AL-N10]NOK72326.1 hypothetical protein [Chloroflexi bacterium AL-N5]NOK79587.1 hypothetical protein [Chloroflexi bacterium AL-W]NOK87503.1 hypothetical protein [Chloroflexi bacterium AL-N15]
MARSDFNYIPVNHEFTVNSPVFETDFRVELASGQSLAEDPGYLLITVRSVDTASHRIQINGQDLSGFDIPEAPGDSNAWLTYMDRIQPNVLRGGTNNLQITRVGNDNFLVKDMVIHWREAP